MPDEIEITRGGVIDVDTEVLRMQRARLEGAAAALRRAENALWRCYGHAGAVPGGEMGAADRAYFLRGLHGEARSRAAELGDTIGRTRLLIEAYEIVELRARVHLADSGDTRGLVELRRSLAMLEERSVLGARLADELMQARESERRAAFALQGWGMLMGGGPLAGLLTHAALRAFMSLVASFGRGTPIAPLGGEVPEVSVQAGRPRATEPAASLSDALSRLPDKPAQVTVERYDLPDGSRQFLVYIAGTRAVIGDDPWNMPSNLALYAEGEVSASYEATRQALIAAGAQPGDAVHALGHSQGAMIAGFLGMAQEFEVQSVFTAGSPIEPQLSETVLSVQLRHSDDVVAALADGGSAAGTGSAGSMVVTRAGDPAFGPQDLFAVSHHMDRYVHTAKLLEASADPRVSAIDAVFAQLGTATQVTTTSFTATTGPISDGSSGGR